jgi:hypothetical protein
MKISKLSFPFILLFIAFVFSQCKKEPVNPNTDDGLPPATQTGANIFACKVNGQNWISGKSSPDLGVSITSDTLAIKGTYHSIGVETIYLLIKENLQQDVAYDVNINNSITYTTTRLCNSGTINFYNYHSNEGQVKLSKLDRTNKIISGTFFFNIIRQNCGDTLRFTNGRFDIKYY